MNDATLPAPGPQLILWVRDRNPYRSGEGMFAYKDRLKLAYREAKTKWERENQQKATAPA